MAKGKVSASSASHFHLSFYCQSESLLFQFILHEFLTVYTKIKEKPQASLFVDLVGHFGSDHHFNPYIFSRQGSLRRFHQYCNYLVSHFPETNSTEQPLLKNLLKSAHLAFMSAIECQRLCEIHSEDLSKEFSRLQKQVKKIAELLTKKLAFYKENENILLFLIRRQEEFHFLYGNTIIGQLLQSFFGGIREAEEFILEKYSQKGFHHLLPVIRQHIETLENAF